MDADQKMIFDYYAYYYNLKVFCTTERMTNETVYYYEDYSGALSAEPLNKTSPWFDLVTETERICDNFSRLLLMDSNSIALNYDDFEWLMRKFDPNHLDYNNLVDVNRQGHWNYYYDILNKIFIAA